jgi:hypothetical protein
MHRIKTVTTTSYRSRETTVSLGPQGTLVTGANTEPVTWNQHRRHVLWTCVFSVLTKEDASFAHGSPLSRRKETLLVYARLLYLEERRRLLSMRVFSVSTKGDTCCVRAPLVSRQKETRAGNVRLFCLDERRYMLWTRVSSISTKGSTSGALRSVSRTSFCVALYIVGILVMGVPCEARYSLIDFVMCFN